MLRILSYAEGYGEFAMARQRYLELPGNVLKIRCRDCSSCSVDCPNDVEVRSRLIHAQALLA
jgi:predicted aldo/keto reductase-like oxidoreductase